jgi:hypothetical protein
VLEQHVLNLVVLEFELLVAVGDFTAEGLDFKLH